MPEGGGHCPACQRVLRSGALFCPACGHTVGAPVPEGAAPVRQEPRAIAPGFAENLDELKRVGWLFGLLLASSFVFGLASRASHSPWGTVALSLVDALIVLTAVGLRFDRLRFLFRIHSIGLPAALRLAVWTTLFVALMAGYFWMLEHLGVPISSATRTFDRAGWPVWSMFLLVSLMPAFFEELAFRGVIQSSLERVFNTRDAWLIQAALFSVLHLAPLAFPSHFLMGLCFGMVRRRTRSVYPGMVLHASWNAYVVLGELWT
ncbi:MAG TPA: CPBP family glutamic-type intramembrane protease [Burkholderiales bacterium]